MEIGPEMLELLQIYAWRAGLALIILIVGWIVSKWGEMITRRILGRGQVDEALRKFLSSLVKYAILAAAVVAALQKAGIAVAGVLAVLGAAGLAIGLALQGSLSNFASGVMILLFRPFTVGDKVTGGGHTGKVDEVGLFATILITPDNERIYIPNGKMMGDSIVNHTTLGTLRGSISIGVGYGSDLQQVIQILEKSVKRCELALEDPAPSVVFDGFGASSLDLSVRAWAPVSDLYPMLHQVRLNIYDDLDAAGIDIPFDQIVVHQP